MSESVDSLFELNLRVRLQALPGFQVSELKNVISFKFVMLLGIGLHCSSLPLMAQSTVSGFFRSDLVRAGVFEVRQSGFHRGEMSQQSASVAAHSSNSEVLDTALRSKAHVSELQSSPSRAVRSRRKQKIPHYRGRFVTDMHGTISRP